ncbi:energy transducer TonB [Adhaeribacter sp. BT258]|uniref:Energy transducer TonB n=1 Tax=Adhaeribacter terrigena TaxID=2793070 RepID=A0ABS1BWG7_9BACT|nr:energy transducer TonB [Adhaeribacter terrigena]MBK0401458.1 energy transducer TonB [Adhaeribacter terrigena]
MKFPSVFTFSGKAVLMVLGVLAFFSSVPVLAQQAKTDQVYTAVEQPAQPGGGIEAFSEYISRNLTYPTVSLKQKTQGTVEVTFIVEKNGTISNINIEKGLDQACNEESLRLVRNSPKWQPAKHGGKHVRQRISMPLIFRIPDTTATAATTKNSGAGNLPEYNENLELKAVTPEQPARPVNGTDAFFAYIRENQKYTAKARRNQIQGKVMVEFMVEKDGRITNLKILKPLGNGLDEEAIRLIENGPMWLPALFQGQPIRQKMILPVIFQL